MSIIIKLTYLFLFSRMKIFMTALLSNASQKAPCNYSAISSVVGLTTCGGAKLDATSVNAQHS